MIFLPAARGRSSFTARRALGRGSCLAGFTSLSLVVLACGAGGETGGGVIPTDPGDGVGPMIGNGGRSNTGSGVPTVPGQECNGPSCDLAGGPDGVTPQGCGDGTLTDDEACDDGNTDSGDGCAANCLATEPGFSC